MIKQKEQNINAHKVNQSLTFKRETATRVFWKQLHGLLWKQIHGFLWKQLHGFLWKQLHGFSGNSFTGFSGNSYTGSLLQSLMTVIVRVFVMVWNLLSTNRRQ